MQYLRWVDKEGFFTPDCRREIFEAIANGFEGGIVITRKLLNIGPIAIHHHDQGILLVQLRPSPGSVDTDAPLHLSLIHI